MSQTTRCPHCGTTFRVVPDQLRIGAGWVRCGRCKEVFDATEHLHSQEAAPAPRVCPFCKQQIADDATRCPYCTSKLEGYKNSAE